MNSNTGRLMRVLAIGVVVIAGCSARSLRNEPEKSAIVSNTSGDHQVTIRTDKEVYGAGEDVLLTIENGLDSPIVYYSGCSIHLCQQVEDDWLCEMKECHAETIELEAGSSVVMVFPGRVIGTRLKYRLEYSTSEGNLYTLDSNEFTIGQASGLVRSAVSKASVLQYLEIVEAGNFHQMALEGKGVFREGAIIPNYIELFKPFPYSEPQPGRARFTLYSFSGEASAGEIYLILEQGSGKIIGFNSFEAFLE